ncbi:MTAP family purine nucleoside phosphorylase [Candidatus Uhrbacteria bacterium]|nr:MTAP family purine nucleoside phosphorylase [Candidatus Uhrbacteria bacterium]
MSESRYCLGVIGGSGIISVGEGVEFTGEPIFVKANIVDTPYGPPSGPIVKSRGDRVDFLFLARHGLGHSIPPSAINVRANIYALKTLGATHVVSISAVGSLRGSIEPGHLVAVNQIIDRTLRRASTFFDEPGIAAHVGFADPVCPSLRAALIAAVREEVPDVVLHSQGTIVVIEGPRFSTRAESEQYRQTGADVIGMNAMPEAVLCREAELPYALLALSTDYDCWHRGEEAVSADMVAAVMRANSGKAVRAIIALADRLPDPATSPAYRCLDSAIMTSPQLLTEGRTRKLAWLRPFSAIHQ